MRKCADVQIGFAQPFNKHYFSDLDIRNSDFQLLFGAKSKISIFALPNFKNDESRNTSKKL